ncbi:MAG TPA: chemotaxis protein CheB [Thermoanaerobaculia bacterium]|nr:chemotaxis protein CheB [Thermoanaerobaculia bacterium]
MPNRDIVVIGASAGGVAALSNLVGELPHDFPAAVFIVLHVSRYGTSAMPAILSRAGVLPASHPRDGEPFEPGRIYVAPPDHHLVLEPGRVRLSRGPSENGHRPAVDVLFRTAAHSYKNRVIGVVLTGNLDDGTAGLAEIKAQNGLAVAQDPEDADHPAMPSSAIANVAVDHVLALGEIPGLLLRRVRETVPTFSDPSEEEEGVGMKEKLEDGADRNPGDPSGYTCPECGGALWESHAKEVLHFRCRTGHAFSPESLIANQSDSLEVSLWAAVRALQENASLARRMERWMEQRGSEHGRHRYQKRASDAERHADILKEILLQNPAEMEAESELGRAVEGAEKRVRPPVRTR